MHKINIKTGHYLRNESITVGPNNIFTNILSLNSVQTFRQDSTV